MSKLAKDQYIKQNPVNIYYYFAILHFNHKLIYKFHYIILNELSNHYCFIILINY
jgi:hypothetical protein